MSNDVGRWRWRIGVTIPVFVAVLSWVLDAFNARFVWSRILDVLGSVPVVVYWVLSVAAAFAVGRRVKGSRRAKELHGEPGTARADRGGAADGNGVAAPGAELEETETQSEPSVLDTTEVGYGDGGLEANEEPDADAKSTAEPEWIDQFDAEDLVRQSNYWSRVKRRSALDKIEAKRDYEEYDIEPETDPYELASEEIAPPRHTPNVDALLQHFWDDHPAGRDGDLYQRRTLLDWLEEQAYEVTLPTD